jgi:hypothetical protein
MMAAQTQGWRTSSSCPEWVSRTAVIDNADQFDAQETARQVQVGVCTNAENSSTMKKEGFSYEYHYRTKDGLALTDFKITTCE